MIWHKNYLQDDRVARTKTLCFLTIVLSVFVQTNLTYAASSLGTMATGTTSDLAKIGPLVEIVAYLGGAVFCVAGLFQLLQAAKQPGASKAPALWTLIIGVGLLGFGAIISAGSGTVFGSDETSTGLGKLGIGR